MNIKSQQAKNSFLFLFIYLCSLSLQPAFATQSKEVITTDIWAATATVFKLVGEKAVNNVKLNWMQREDISGPGDSWLDSYSVLQLP